jgi:uncharacterized SAM-binding protein YcdF (DUF218 family)
MFASLKSLAATLLMPVPVALLLVLLGAWIAARGARRTGFVAVFAGFLLLFLAAWSPVADRLLEPLEQAYKPVLEVGALEDVAAVVVLGAGWEPDADWPVGTRLNDSAVHRLMEGLRLLQALPEAAPSASRGGLHPDVPRLVVSGGSRRPNMAPVAQGYAQAARELGVPAERIVVLDTPTDTAQEAYAVREALGTEARFLLVTSASHMQRAVRHFERVGLAPIPSPTHFRTGRGGPHRLSYWVPSSGNLAKTERAVHEYLGLWALELDHRSRP